MTRPDYEELYGEGRADFAPDPEDPPTQPCSRCGSPVPGTWDYLHPEGRQKGWLWTADPLCDECEAGTPLPVPCRRCEEPSRGLDGADGLCPPCHRRAVRAAEHLKIAAGQREAGFPSLAEAHERQAAALDAGGGLA